MIPRQTGTPDVLGSLVDDAPDAGDIVGVLTAPNGEGLIAPRRRAGMSQTPHHQGADDVECDLWSVVTESRALALIFRTGNAPGGQGSGGPRPRVDGTGPGRDRRSRDLLL